jgi:hypothetical protein
LDSEGRRIVACRKYLSRFFVRWQIEVCVGITRYGPPLALTLPVQLVDFIWVSIRLPIISAGDAVAAIYREASSVA